MRKGGWLIAIIVLAVVVVGVWLTVEKQAIDTRLEHQREAAEASQLRKAGVDVAAMARKWNAATAWNSGHAINAALDAGKVQGVLTATRNVVFLGRVDSIVAGAAGAKYFITLTDVDDRLLVRLTCDAAQIGKFRDAAGVDRLYALYAAVASVSGVRRAEARVATGGATPLYDFVVEAQCVDALPLHFSVNTRLSELVVPGAGR